MKHNLICALVICFCFSCSTKNDLPESTQLHENWKLNLERDSTWLPAQIPGNVFSDLLRNEIIEDPFIGNNELEVQWVSESDWEYSSNFSVDDELLQKSHLELSFEGLDTYASVFLNDSLILKSDNAFRSFEVSVLGLLKNENELRILFKRSSKYEDIAKLKLPYNLPEGNRIFSRKAQFQYGWDWGPKLNVSGIWRPISLTGWNDAIIKNTYVQHGKITDSVAVLKTKFEILTTASAEAIIDIYVNNSFSESIPIQLESHNKNYEISFNIDEPQLWWPHNLGTPYLYALKFVLREKNKILDEVEVKYGISDIELVSEKDNDGASFYFKVNGVPVFMKGANYIPQNSFQDQVSDAHYNELLNSVTDANMNMLRVWGGGVYENDIFYDLCDEKGILVWQDFMFACAMYPGDDMFLENVKQEAIDNVKRLRNHPSIALWCGNNENSEGWHRWGWQDGRSEAEKDEIWKNYLNLFDSILPNVVKDYSEASYWESSPRYGRGNPKYKTEGDAHDWWIWHDAYPFEHLEANVPRFMSEFGFQSFPSFEVISYINQSDSLDISTKEFKNHQKHSRGFELIETYMERDFPVPDSTEDYIYMSQLLQAYGICKGIEAHRRARPYTMGTLYWQLNDCWPAVSWSSIDYLGQWKALHYKAKKSFENVLISSESIKDSLYTYIINDNFWEEKGELKMEVLNFNGKVLWQKSTNISVQENAAQRVHELDLNKLRLNRDAVVIVSKFKGESSYFYLVKPKDLQLIKGSINQKITKVSDGFAIELISDVLQKDVFLYCNSKGQFDDNFFDLLPGQTKTVFFKSSSDKIDELKIKTFNNLIR